MNKPLTSTDSLRLSEEDWRAKLTPDQYAVCRLKGTEPPGSGRYLDHWEKGDYACVACRQPLFTSKTKYKSGCGWPAFYDAIPGAVATRSDFGTDVEAICARCESHLGHIFNDGPPPTRKRY